MTGHAIQPSPGPDTAPARRALVFFLFALGCFLLPALFIPARPVAAVPPPLELTDQERRFIETHPEIRVVFDPEFPPFEFLSHNEFSGLSADLLRAALKGTGLAIIPTPAQDWPALLEALKERRADMAAKIVYTPERAKYLLFTQPYISIPVVIIVSAKNNAIQSLDDLAGRRVAMVPGYGGDRWFTEHGPAGTTPVPVATVREALRKVAFGEVEAFVGNQGVVSYLIEKEGLPNLRLAGAIDQESALRMAVRDDWPELRSILDKALGNLPNEGKQAIIHKWLPLRQGAAPPHWTVFVLTGLFAATLAISVLFHLYSRGLKRGIAEKTRELEAEFARRESAEKALRERDLHLRNVLLNADAVVFEIAPDGTVVHIEGKALEKIGLSPQKMAGRPVSDFFGDNQMVMDGLARTLSGKPVNYIAELEEQHASIMAAPVFGEHGEITGIFGVATDMTSLALARKHLAESEKRLALILDATNDGFVDWDMATDIAHLSPWLVDAYGLSSNTITDVVETWLSRVHPEDRQRALAHLEAGLVHDDIIEDQYRLVTPSGAVRWILDRGRVVARNETGKALRFVGTATDITDRKESELRYQALFQAATDAIMILENGRITDCNPATSTLLGYTREELLGRTPQEFSPSRQPDGRPSSELAAHFLSQVATGNVVFEWVHRRNDGEPVEVEASLTPLPSINGNMALALVRDITQRKKMQEALIHTEKMASLGRLAAGMANEINNPLAIILHSAQGTLRRLDPELPPNAEAAKRHNIDLARVLEYLAERRILTYLDGIREAGDRVAAIVRGMLGFARVPESARENADINALVESSLLLASSEYNSNTRYDFRRITIVKRLTPDLPPVPCMPAQIKQVILTLLRNAAQVLTEAAIPMPSITLRTFTRDDQAVIEVGDNGPGIPAEVLPRVFEPFFSARKTGGGAGLGLSVASVIVTHNHGGRLTVSSEPDKGTVFAIVLPLIPGQAASQAAF